jgi:hypothetical protein
VQAIGSYIYSMGTTSTGRAVTCSLLLLRDATVMASQARELHSMLNQAAYCRFARSTG